MAQVDYSFPSRLLQHGKRRPPLGSPSVALVGEALAPVGRGGLGEGDSPLGSPAAVDTRVW